MKNMFYPFALAAFVLAGCEGCGDPEDPGNSVVIGGVTWAARNVGTTPGKFTSKPQDYGGYWSAAMDSSFAGGYVLNFSNDNVSATGVHGRAYGISARCVAK